VVLEIDRSLGGGALPGYRAAGRYLSDHLSTAIASVPESAVPAAARLFGPRFDGSVIRAVRMIDPSLLGERPAHFAHLTFALEDPGFALAKKVLGAIQARRYPPVGLSEVFRGSAGLAALAFERFARQRLRVPRGTAVGLQLDVEQEPCFQNAVLLRGERDEYGRPSPEVRWSVQDSDRRNIEAIGRSLLAKWAELGAVLPTVTPIAPRDLEAKLHDAYHPVGVCRMGTDDDAVLAPDLALRGVDNVRVLSTAAFPCAGSANPTLTLLCFAEDLAQDPALATA
jgi:choline dehydrogenase-like flavoprotein